MRKIHRERFWGWVVSVVVPKTAQTFSATTRCLAPRYPPHMSTAQPPANTPAVGQDKG